jgi:peptidoglycan/xylan/chitin deacetylase (PgdA/CDA1 family)
MRHEQSPISFIEKAAGTILLTVAIAGCKGTAPTPNFTSLDNSSSRPIPTETSTATAEPTVTLTPTASPTLEPTPTPTVEPTPTLRPTANPKIKCDQWLVPDAIPVPAITKEPAKSFKLNVPILEYHRIIGPEAKGLAHLKVPPKTFDAQMKKLYDNGWHTITLAKLAGDLEHEITPPAKTFVVTFDDGYADGYLNALPILQKYGFVGTYFIITSRRNGSFLTPTEVKALSQAGNEIADHTAYHVSLTSGKADQEVDSAALYIAQTTGKWPSTLAYPYGSYNSYAKNAVARCQPMRMAVIQEASSGPKAIETWSNRFQVPRIKISPGTSPKYLLQKLTPYAGK